MIDIKYINTMPWETAKRILKVKYTFRNMPFLVSDKYGNFFILEHCPNKRTIPFKHLDSSKGYIYYRGNKVRLSTLRCRSITTFKNIQITMI